MPYVMKRRPLGLYNGEEWPEVGQPAPIDGEHAAAMAAAGWLTEVEATKPDTSKVETATKSTTPRKASTRNRG